MSETATVTLGAVGTAALGESPKRRPVDVEFDPRMPPRRTPALTGRVPDVSRVPLADLLERAGSTNSAITVAGEPSRILVASFNSAL